MLCKSAEIVWYKRKMLLRAALKQSFLWEFRLEMSENG